MFNKVEQRGEFGLFLGYNHKTGEALIFTKEKRELIKTRYFKVSQISDKPLYESVEPNNNFVPPVLINENSSGTESHQTENQSEHSFENSVQNSPEVKITDSEKDNNK
eukprot:snap_masked-scaffold_57-processed-gene-0.26-mRNA-1 protein AED:1.00 eAED:1.00 QI:0/0/0/0/1/1/2/0/107